jgi:hypothetical protein
MSVSSITNPEIFERKNQKLLIGPGGAKVGGTAGWTLAAANNTSLATVAASQTGAKLVIPVTGLKIGSVITGFYGLGQIESAGNAVTLDIELRKHTAAAADVVDASVSSITQISVTADAAVTATNARKAGLAEMVNEDETFYFVLTATTGLTTDIALQGVVIEYTER